MLTQVHLAVQYLATAAKSFLEPKADDSYTNLGYITAKNRLETWALDTSGTKLAFSFTDFSLQWLGNTFITYPLDGRSHTEIVAWLSGMAKDHKFENSYAYRLHYDLPYSATNGFKFQNTDPKSLEQLGRLRALAQEVLKTFLEKEHSDAEIRIWPHHLDTGAFLTLENSDKAIGLGMAIPDALVADHYFYISGYSGHDSLATSGFAPLAHGTWKNDGFKGAVFPVSNSTVAQGIAFFQETYQTYMK